ncbi:hypothetical protein ACVQEB_003970 [Pseudomonas aeruginosa]|nr:hypothetical protein [Pseudomonas aeruginosa]
MKRFFVVMAFLISTHAFAVQINDNAEILYLDKPYTITHLIFLDVDCVWTRGEKGRLNSEALGPNSSGVCWDEKAVAQVEKLDREKKLIWHDPPSFDYEYGDKNKCYYKVDRKGGFVLVLFGDGATAADDCDNGSNKEKALTLATKIEKKVEFGGWVATRKNLLGSLVLACYTGISDSGGAISLSKEEQTRRYNALLGLYEGDQSSIKRITNAYEFARRNLSDRYPLDTTGQYRAGVCDQMVRNGKL